jgi:hypothetical protein
MTQPSQSPRRVHVEEANHGMDAIRSKACIDRMVMGDRFHRRLLPHPCRSDTTDVLSMEPEYKQTHTQHRCISDQLLCTPPAAGMKTARVASDIIKHTFSKVGFLSVAAVTVADDRDRSVTPDGT